jgi:hypothetical protein
MDLAIDELLSAVEDVRESLEIVRSLQTEDSDKGNEDKIYQATAALDALEAAVSDIVP